MLSRWGLSLPWVVVAVLSVALVAQCRVSTDPSSRYRRTVEWMDDFLGLTVDDRYSKVICGNGSIAPATDGSGSSVGGIVSLSVSPAQPQNGCGSPLSPPAARLRLGEDESSPDDPGVRNWNAQKNLTFESRLYLSSTQMIQATVGFIGARDPQHVVAAVYNHDSSSDESPHWRFQVCNIDAVPQASSQPADTSKYCEDIDTGFAHEAGTWTTFRIVTDAGPPLTARLYINDKLVAKSVSNPLIPTSDLATEFQVWNKSDTRSWSAAAMVIDYVHVEQDR